MRRTATGLVVVLVAAVLAGCGDVNKGSAFASEFQAFLDDRDDLEVAEASGTNPLPWSGTGDVSVQVVDGLSDGEIVDVVWEITAHEVENQVGYGLEVRFPAQTGGGDPALAAFHLGVPGPAPEEDEADLRAEIERRLDQARDLVAFGLGETTASADSRAYRMRSQGDALTVASAMCADLGLERVIDVFTVEGPSPVGTLPEGTLEDDPSAAGPGSHVTLEDSSDCAWVPDVLEVVTLATAAGPVVSYSASHASYDATPAIRVTYAGGVPLDLSAAQARAVELGLELTVS